MTPRVATERLTLRSGDVKHITLLSDLHMESRMCNLELLIDLLKDRSKLPNHSVCILGDTLDLIASTDLKRHRESVRNELLIGIDKWANMAVDFAVDKLKSTGCKFDLVSVGNHEDEWLKRHNSDMVSAVAQQLNANRGGYSGCMDYQIGVLSPTQQPSSEHKIPSIRFRLLYHHGAWGGRMSKGYNSALPWAQQVEGWNVFAYGHNHASRVDPEVRIKIVNNRFEKYKAYIVNCSSWVETISQDAEITHYAERSGYIQNPNVAPLVRIVVDRGKSVGMKYSVEV